MAPKEIQVPPECPIKDTCRKLLNSGRNPVTVGDQDSAADTIHRNAERVYTCLQGPSRICGAAVILSKALRAYDAQRRQENMSKFTPPRRKR